jgi:CheY-like chemotaxis protein
MAKILVADDEQNVRLLFNEALTDVGYQVLTAVNGHEALQKIFTERPDLVILDIKMPGLHGIEVLQKIREHDEDLPVIICTAFRHMDDDFIVGTSHISGYLVKPVDVEELKEKVQEALRGRSVEAAATEGGT